MYFASINKEITLEEFESMYQANKNYFYRDGAFDQRLVDEPETMPGLVENPTEEQKKQWLYDRIYAAGRAITCVYDLPDADTPLSGDNLAWMRVHKTYMPIPGVSPRLDIDDLFDEIHPGWDQDVGTCNYVMVLTKPDANGSRAYLTDALIEVVQKENSVFTDMGIRRSFATVKGRIQKQFALSSRTSYEAAGYKFVKGTYVDDNTTNMYMVNCAFGWNTTTHEKLAEPGEDI